MPTVREITSLAETIASDLAKWYEDNSVPCAFRPLSPLVVARAAILCEGDWRRCVTDGDGSLIVYDKPHWEPDGARA